MTTASPEKPRLADIIKSAGSCGQVACEKLLRESRFGSISTNMRRNLPNLGQHWPGSTKLWPTPGNLCRHRPASRVDQPLFGLGDSCQIWPTLVIVWPMSAQIFQLQPNFGQPRPSLAQIRPSFSQPWPVSASPGTPSSQHKARPVLTKCSGIWPKLCPLATRVEIWSASDNFLERAGWTYKVAYAINDVKHIQT